MSQRAHHSPPDHIKNVYCQYYIVLALQQGIWLPYNSDLISFQPADSYLYSFLFFNAHEISALLTVDNTNRIQTPTTDTIHVCIVKEK